MTAERKYPKGLFEERILNTVWCDDSLYRGEMLSMCVRASIDFDSEKFKGFQRYVVLKESEKLANSSKPEQYYQRHLEKLIDEFPALHTNFLNRISKVFESYVSLPISNDTGLNLNCYIFFSNDEFTDFSEKDHEIFIVIPPIENYTKISPRIRTNEIVNLIMNKFNNEYFKPFKLEFDLAYFDLKKINFNLSITSIHQKTYQTEFFKCLSLVQSFIHYADSIIENIDFHLGNSDLWQTKDKHNQAQIVEATLNLSRYFIVLESIFLCHDKFLPEHINFVQLTKRLEASLNIKSRYKSVEESYTKLIEFSEQNMDKSSIHQALKEGFRDDLALGTGISVSLFLALLTSEIKSIKEAESGSLLYTLGENKSFADLLESFGKFYTGNILFCSLVSFGLVVVFIVIFKALYHLIKSKDNTWERSIAKRRIIMRRRKLTGEKIRRS